MPSFVAQPVLEVEAERPAAWSEPVPIGRRLRAFAWWFGIGLAISVWLASEQLANNVRDSRWLWPIGIFSFAFAMAVRSFRKREVRLYDSTTIRYTMRQRIERSAKWFVPGVALLTFIWGIQLSNHQFAMYWWYAWPALFPILVGVGLYLLRSEQVISSLGEHARAQDEPNGRLDALLNIGPVRYAIAAVFFYLSYDFAFNQPGKKTALAVGALVMGLIFAREMSLGLIGVAVVVGIGWALYAGIAALPVSVAVVVGALIIAFAVSKR